MLCCYHEESVTVLTHVEITRTLEEGEEEERNGERKERKERRGRGGKGCRVWMREGEEGEVITCITK